MSIMKWEEHSPKNWWLETPEFLIHLNLYFWNPQDLFTSIDAKKCSPRMDCLIFLKILGCRYGVKLLHVNVGGFEDNIDVIKEKALESALSFMNEIFDKILKAKKDLNLCLIGMQQPSPLYSRAERLEFEMDRKRKGL